MKVRTRLIGALAAAALVVVVVGCGGGDDSDTSTAASVPTEATPAAITKAELIALGDGICAEVNAAIGTVAASDTESASQVAQEADLYSGMVERLKGLGTPDDTVGYDEFIGASDTLAQAQSDASLAAARGDTTALQAAESEASTALASFQSAAQAYGFEECGEAPSAPTPSGTASPTETESSGGIEEGEVEEAAPEVEEAPEVAPETGGAGSAETGGGTSGGGTEGSSGSSSGGIGPG